MNSKIEKRILTNPKALMDFKLSGKAPSVRKARQTPLLKALRILSPIIRGSILSITIGPKLGYSRDITFQSAEQLWNWLGGDRDLGDWETLPSESMSIGRFNKKIELADILSHSKKYPDLKHIKIRQQ